MSYKTRMQNHNANLQIILDAINNLPEYTPESPEISDYEQLINYTMLYDSGNECGDVTGGWDSTWRESGYFTKKNNSLCIANNGRDMAAKVSTVNTVDFTDYVALYFNYHLTQISANYVGTGIGYDNSNTGFSLFGTTADYNSNYQHPYNTAVDGDFFREIDVSNIKGENYCVFIGNYASGNNEINVYNCVTVKEDDISALCEKAGLSVPESLEALLADTTALTTIFNNEEAVKFMVRQCTGDFMVTAIQNKTFLTALANSEYKEEVYLNEHWAKFLDMVGKLPLKLYQEGDNIANFSKNGSNGSHTVTFNSDNIYMYGYFSASNTWCGAGIVTAESYDLTNFSKICFELENVVIEGTSTISMGITTERDGNQYDVFENNATKIAYLELTSAENGVFEIPIDNTIGLTGYPKIQVRGRGGKVEAYIKNIWLK